MMLRSDKDSELTTMMVEEFCFLTTSALTLSCLSKDLPALTLS